MVSLLNLPTDEEKEQGIVRITDPDANLFEKSFTYKLSKVKEADTDDDWHGKSVRTPEFIQKGVWKLHRYFGNEGVRVTASAAVRYGFQSYTQEYGDQFTSMQTSFEEVAGHTSMSISPTFDHERSNQNDAHPLSFDVHPEMSGIINEYRQAFSVPQSPLYRQFIATALAHADRESDVSLGRYGNYAQEYEDRFDHILQQQADLLDVLRERTGDTDDY